VEVDRGQHFDPTVEALEAKEKKVVERL